jgi:hypothetical protein
MVPMPDMIFSNRSAAPHLRTIGPAYVHEVRSAGPLVQICGTAERLQSGGFGNLMTAPVIAYRIGDGPSLGGLSCDWL